MYPVAICLSSLEKFREFYSGNSLTVQWLGLRPSTAGSMASIPGQGTKIPCAARCGQKILKFKKRKRKMSIQFLWPFSNWIVLMLSSCMSSVHILDINPLSDRWFTNIFSHSIAAFSFCGWFPLLCRSFFLDVVPLVYFCFCCFCFWCHIQKITAKTNVKELPPIVFSSSFTVSGLTFKSLILFFS